MSQTRSALPTLYHPSDVAKALGKSEWWVKEQARKQRIPFTKPGRAYRFTADQVAEIIRLYETRPNSVSAAALPLPTARSGRAVERHPAGPVPTTRLRARAPRRVAQSQKQQEAA